MICMQYLNFIRDLENNFVYGKTNEKCTLYKKIDKIFKLKHVMSLATS
jgi:hypothetical protein